MLRAFQTKFVLPSLSAVGCRDRLRCMHSHQASVSCAEVEPHELQFRASQKSQITSNFIPYKKFFFKSEISECYQNNLKMARCSYGCMRNVLKNDRWGFMEIILETLVVIFFTTDLSHFLLRTTVSSLRRYYYSRADIGTEMQRWNLITVPVYSLQSNPEAYDCYWISSLAEHWLPINISIKYPTCCKTFYHNMTDIVCANYSEAIIPYVSKSSYNKYHVNDCGGWCATAILLAYVTLSLCACTGVSLAGNYYYGHWTQPVLYPRPTQDGATLDNQSRPGNLLFTWVGAILLGVITLVLIVCIPVMLVVFFIPWLGYVIFGHAGVLPVCVFTVVLLAVYSHLCLFGVIRPPSRFRLVFSFLMKNSYEWLRVPRKDLGDNNLTDYKWCAIARLGCVFFLLALCGIIIFPAYPQFNTAVNLVYSYPYYNTLDNSTLVLGLNQARLADWVNPLSLYSKSAISYLYWDHTSTDIGVFFIIGQIGLVVSLVCFLIAIVFIVGILPGLLIFLLYSACKDCSGGQSSHDKTVRTVWQNRCRIAAMAFFYTATQIVFHLAVTFAGPEQAFLPLYLLWIAMLAGDVVREVKLIIQLSRRGPSFSDHEHVALS
ncbi:uncharacterized protein LOC129601052 isoform X1 [Paramacrobiotus metropolitanus]|uniref:uncharacterized protein LOC129601052 isoform X1 n=1 Tax=Paramacrobiotus metropolitanus TaxID=2943436 RepID=UPI0024464B4B|nr:uncharacterized protein LOC129601052 isoform X1 [Paramacrobiotus metropolitanus]